MDSKNVNYVITWTQVMYNWEPLVLNQEDAVEDNITDFSDAQKVLQKIMSK
jgi:hypothetical protein